MCCLEIVDSDIVSRVGARAAVIEAVCQSMAQGRSRKEHSTTPLLRARQTLLASQCKIFK